MTPRAHSPTYLLAFWPLVLLALIARLTFGGIASPAALVDDPLKTFTKLSILCDDQSTSPDPDGQHHRSTAPDDDGFLLSEALGLLVVSIVFCLFMGLCVAGIRQTWMFTSIRGPPTPKRTSLCPQGPPA
ncbi:hypothetical protein S1001342_02939 (plasmid) [Acetobacter pasteurianus subsp. pasteurianus]|uniref:Uncharacterized protein n=1 Tax=Acetobacter pasteurianus subsp. pasteurianus TaxID=481145 RepID=A0A1Y0Y203_ACEPA|nr:hypothetical protein S1001342_02939 [Acetobacter pasteurianus subsp. pasteurianus]